MKRVHLGAAAVSCVLVVLTLIPALAGARARASHVANASTVVPAFAQVHYRVKAGRTVSVTLDPRAAWGDPQTCRLTISHRRARPASTTVRRVLASLTFTLQTARGARGGAWTLSARCAAARTARSTLTVTGARPGAHGWLTVRGGIAITRSQNLAVARAGYGGADVGPNPGFPNGECVYYAFIRRPDIYWTSRAGGAPVGGWDAYKWAQYAAQYGHFQEGQTPLVGSIMVEPGTPSNPAGHVAYVDKVTDPGHFITLEMNTDNGATPDKVFTVYNDFGSPPGTRRVGSQIQRHVLPGTVFIYGGPVINPPQYAGEVNRIVQWNGDTKAQKTAWLVVDDGGQLQRHWIPTIAIYWCLRNSGIGGPDVLPAAELNALPDQSGVWATCAGNSAPPGSGGGDLPPTAEATYSELEGHNGVNTFTDPVHAAGVGQRVAPGQTVQVSCKVYDPQVASVNPDGYWYRLASAPWSDGYYAPANTFMNGDPWNGPYTHNTDMSVPDCGSGGGTPPPPPSQTWAETVGGSTNTWTDYTSAGGSQGQTILAGQSVQVACKVPGFKVADGDTWWYRIASAPWNRAYYASADAFYNNGQTSGSLIGTPFVDTAVANC